MKQRIKVANIDGKIVVLSSSKTFWAQSRVFVAQAVLTLATK